MTSASAPAPVDASVAAINFAWLRRLRWWALLGKAVLIAGVVLTLGVEVFWGPMLAIGAIELISVFAVSQWTPDPEAISRRVVPALLVLDVLLFTGLLHVTGGSSNPFSFLYLVYIALGAVVLTPAWSWGLAAFAQLAFGTLFLVRQHEHHATMQLHLQGMWVAFGVAAVFIVYFVQRVTRALASREAELRESRSKTERQARIASLATLAAGAAHELSTPLSVIAVVARELERSTQGTALDDVLLVRQQVGRCREILSQMAADVGATQGENATPLELGEWVRAASDGLPGSEQIRIEAPAEVLVLGPRRALTHALRGLLKNALQASAAPSPVEVSLRRDGADARLIVADRGRGMPQDELARAGEPFFTTKAPGEGIGLGLFISRAVLEQLGGRLELSSTPGVGTRAALVLPPASIRRTGSDVLSH